MKKKNKNKIIKLFIFCLLIILYVFIYSAQKDLIINFINWVLKFGLFGKITFAFVYIVATIIIMPGMPLAVISGVIYGCFDALLIIVPASIIGGSISFLMGRYFFRTKTLNFIKNNSYIKIINNKINKNGFLFVILIFSYPLTPFRILNYAISITKLKFKSFVLALSVSMFMHMIPYVYFGSILHSYKDVMNYTFYELIRKNSNIFLCIIIFSVFFFLIWIFILLKFKKNNRKIVIKN